LKAGTTVTYKEIFQLSLPIMAGSAIENLTAIINIAFLGRVGSVALGAVAIGGIFYLALVMLGFGFGIGTQIIVSRRYGEKNYSDIGATLHHAFAFLLPLAIVILILVHAFGAGFFQGFLKSNEVLTGVREFMYYRIWGILFAFTNILFRAFYIGIQKTFVIGLCSMIIAVFNIFLDFSLIFGNFGFPKMGVAGAGLSSVVAEIAGTIFLIVYTIYRRDINEFALTKFAKLSMDQLRRIFKVASPVMLQFSISFGGWFAFFLMVEKMGEIPLAASNIIRTFYMIVLLPIWGYAAATNTLVSYKMGSSAVEEIVPLMKKLIGLSLLTVTALVIITDLFSTSFFKIFTNNPVLIEACHPILVVVSISSVLVTFAVIIFNVVSGAGKTQVTLITEFIVISLYVAWTYFLVHFSKSSIAMVWSAEILYGVAMGILSGLYLKFGNWRKGVV
jgi:putative MATE family efflux protein